MVFRDRINTVPFFCAFIFSLYINHMNLIPFPEEEEIEPQEGWLRMNFDNIAEDLVEVYHNGEWISYEKDYKPNINKDENKRND